MAQNQSAGSAVAARAVEQDAKTKERVAELEARIDQLKRELKRSDEEAQYLIFMAFHDLREATRMVSGYTRLLARRYSGKLDSEADEFIGYALGGVARLERLSEDLLAYSRIVIAPPRIVGPANADIVLESTLNGLETQIRESGAEVTRGPLATVMADELQLGQVFRQLVENAIKFRGSEPPKIAISAEQQGDEWVFSVRDNGIGIDPKYGEAIFAAFKRLHGREYPGTGLGLTIARKIVERHGGRIWVEPQDKGSVFRFTLPA